MKLLLAAGLITLGFILGMFAKAHAARHEIRVYRSTRAAMMSSALAQSAKWAALACLAVGVLLLR